MTIEITDLEFDTIVGLLDFERTTPQRVRIDCAIEYVYRDAGKIQSNTFIDYALVVEHIQREMHTHHFLLLEDALLSLRRSLKKKFSMIKQIKLRIMKPDILDNCEVALTLSHKY